MVTPLAILATLGLLAWVVKDRLYGARKLSALQARNRREREEARRWQWQYEKALKEGFYD